jgi:hypothetical protein
MSLNRYEHAWVKEKISGYMVGRHPTETHEQEFGKAKAEMLVQLKRQIEQVEAFDYSELIKKYS